MSLEIILATVMSTFGAAGTVYFLMSRRALKKTQQETETKAASQTKNNAFVSAETEAKRIILDAKSDALKIKQDAEREARQIRRKSLQIEKRAERRQDELYTKIKEIDRKETELRTLRNKWKRKLKNVEDARNEQITKLEKISSLTKEEARSLMLKNLEKTLENDVIRKIKEAEEKIQSEIDKKTKELLADAMHHASTDYVAEYTISSVKLLDEDMKGRIIGKEGRNIRAFEDATGVNVDFENDSEVRLSSFDSVRREIAKRSMEKLLKDGRIHPGRIEEIVRKTKIEVDKIILKAGEELCQAVGVYNLPNELVKKLGNFKFRTSYGQNMIQHALEETKIGVQLANDLGADIAITKLACLLHDIGKVVTDKEGNHVELGAEYLMKFNLPKEVITAVREHHDDKPSTIEGIIVQISDSISGSRPGARYEDYEKFVERMKKLEETAKSFEGVEKAFAISAGRELRVIVKPEEIDDDKAIKLSHDIAKKVESEQTYPGTVKVIVIRELRSTATAT